MVGRRQVVAPTAVRRHDRDVRPVIGDKEINVGPRQAAFARQALAEEDGTR